MGMTRRDYVAISKSIRNLWVTDDADPYTIEEAAFSLSEALAENNPRFDSAKFLDSCGVRVADDYVVQA